MASEPVLPLALLTGFLGAGKTTLLRHLLQNRAGLNVGVIVNDISNLNVDADRLSSAKVPLKRFENGCACCSSSGDLLEAVRSLVSLRPRLELIVLELSGVGEPERVQEALLRCPFLQGKIVLGQTICVVDQPCYAATVESRLRQPGARSVEASLVVKQLEASTTVVLNKRDLVSDRVARVVDGAVRAVVSLGPFADSVKVLTAERGAVPLSLLMAPRPFCGGAAVRSKTRNLHGENESARIHTFEYESEVPFHPPRLVENIVRRLPLEGASAPLSVACGLSSPVQGADGSGALSCCVRSKGSAWLASQHEVRFAWDHAGIHFALREDGCWEAPRATRLAFILVVNGTAEALATEIEVRAALDACLLNDDELRAYRLKHECEDSARLAKRARLGEGGSSPAYLFPPTRGGEAQKTPLGHVLYPSGATFPFHSLDQYVNYTGKDFEMTGAFWQAGRAYHEGGGWTADARSQRASTKSS